MDMIFFKEKKILEEIDSIEAHMDKWNDIHNRRISELQRDINFINDFEIDGIKHLDFISASLKELSAGKKQFAFRVGNNIGAVHLHQ